MPITSYRHGVTKKNSMTWQRSIMDREHGSSSRSSRIGGTCAEKTCPKKEVCPYLGFRACKEILAENEQLKAENTNLRRIFNGATKAFKEKESEIEKLNQEAEVLRRKPRDLLQRPFVRNIQDDEDGQNMDASELQQEPTGPSACDAQAGKRRGVPKDHCGTTRKKPDRGPDRTVFVRPKQCPKYHSRNITLCKERQTNPNIAFFKTDKSRAGSVPQSVLGNKYDGVLGFDCYSAYNTIDTKAKQKCLTHYERAAKELEKFFPEDQATLLFNR